MILLGVCAGWSLITAGAHDGRPEGMLLAVLAVTAGHAVGRVSGALLPVAAPSVGAGAGLALLLPGLTAGPRHAAPLGQAGGTAALLALATGAACCAAWATPLPAARLTLRALAAGIVLSGAVRGSAAGCAASAAVLLCSLAAGSVSRRGVALPALAVGAVLPAGMAWVLAADAPLPSGLSRVLDGRLTAHRVALWRDALRLTGRNSGLGVGPGRFGELAATAQQPSPDARPHSALLQIAAEQGVVGVALYVAAFCWVLHGAVAFAALHTGRPDHGCGADGTGRVRGGERRPQLHDGDRRRGAPGRMGHGTPVGTRGDGAARRLNGGPRRQSHGGTARVRRARWARGLPSGPGLPGRSQDVGHGGPASARGPGGSTPTHPG